MGRLATRQAGTLFGAVRHTQQQKVPRMKDWINRTYDTVQTTLSWAPTWMIGPVILVVLVSASLILHRVFRGAMLRLAGPERMFLRSLIARGRGPTEAALVLMAVAMSLPQTYLPDRMADGVLHGLVVAAIMVMGWAGLIAVGLASDLYLRRFRTDVDDNLQARKHVTQVRILRRAVDTVLVLVTIASSLMTIDSVRQYGISLFASAGAAGLILGLSARPVLSNMIAGLQIAITQPIRVEDAVVVEGEWGWIEDIASTYVVIRLWDWRRLIVPLTYFMEKPFQNWTHQTAAIIGSVLLRVDYSTPVDRVREQLAVIAKASPLWSGAVVNLQVSDADGHTMELRALVSASTAPRAWDLRCEVREKLIAFLQAEYPHCLPKQRLEGTSGAVAKPARELIGAF
jgi:small-conductance mechanosensitive channel